MTAAVIIGAGGAIGSALVAQLAERDDISSVHALSRRPIASEKEGVRPGFIDVADPESIAAAANAIEGPIALVIVATGMLHDDGLQPEKALRDLDAAPLARGFAVNTIGPALVLRHFAPLLPRRGRAVFAALSARVGSISDNRAGGWYGYRASKAALTMIVRTAAIELGRTHPDAICVTLHPGTVDSALSRPFQRGVAPDRLFTPGFAAERLLAVLDGLRPEDSGRCFAWDGREIAP